MAKKYRAILGMGEGYFSFDAVIDHVFEAEDRDSAMEKACVITDDFNKVMTQNGVKNELWVVFNILTKKFETIIPDNNKYKSITLKNFEFYDKTKGPFFPFPPTGELNVMNPECFVSLTEEDFCLKMHIEYSVNYGNRDYVTFESFSYNVEEVNE